jgi:hypothetical protein
MIPMSPGKGGDPLPSMMLAPAMIRSYMISSISTTDDRHNSMTDVR